MDRTKQILIDNGYLCMSEEDNKTSFNRGYTPNGFADRVFHLHLRYFGDHDELYFRDYMNDRPDLAREYETLKKSLRSKYEHDRDAYTEAKSEFVKRCAQAAKFAYGHAMNRK